jgi:hypothetical protein
VWNFTRAPRKQTWRNGGQLRPSILLAPLYKEATSRALFDIIHSSKFGVVLKKGGECFVAKGITLNRESKRRVRPKNKSNKFIRYSVPLYLDMCAMQKPQTFN